MIDIDVKVGGLDAVNAALRGAQPSVREATVPVMEMAATSIAGKARGIADPSSPHNLWRGSKGRAISPKYNVKQKGPYWFRVETPGGKVGKVEALAEFMSAGRSPQGNALVSALNSKYGRTGGSGGGRILWKAADELSPSIYSSMERAVAAAAAEIQAKAGEA